MPSATIKHLNIITFFLQNPYYTDEKGEKA